jgi:hypothetical protein
MPRASGRYYIAGADILLEYGADASALGDDWSTSLDQAPSSDAGQLDSIRFGALEIMELLPQ